MEESVLNCKKKLITNYTVYLNLIIPAT